jgi:hypothetical protein
MNIRNHAPTLILRTLWEKPGHKCFEPIPAFDIASISSDWQHWYTNTDNHFKICVLDSHG